LLVFSAFEDLRRMSVSPVVVGAMWLVVFVETAGWQQWPQAFILILITVWALWPDLPAFFVWLFLFYPPYWPVTLLAAGSREGVIGEADVVAMSALALWSPMVAWAGFAGMLLWWLWQRRKGRLWVPALPGILAGVLLFFIGGLWRWGG